MKKRDVQGWGGKGGGGGVTLNGGAWVASRALCTCNSNVTDVKYFVYFENIFYL